MDIDGLGKEIVKLLVNEGLVQDLAGLYRLSYDQLIELEGFKENAPKIYWLRSISRKSEVLHVLSSRWAYVMWVST